jgi:DNA modification methylase
MQIEQIAISALKAYSRNSRTHDKNQIEKVAASITEFGFTNPVLIQDDGTIIAGHGRVEAAIKLDMTTVPCLRLSHLTPEQAKAYVIADNALAELSGWDNDMLKLELGDLQEHNFDLELLGLDNLDKLLAQIPGTEGNTDPDAIPDPPAVPKAQRGQVWRLGEHRLMCGDSTVFTDVEMLMGGIKADLVFSDPPYGVSYADKNIFLNAIDKGCRIQTEIKNDHMAVDDMQVFWQSAFENMLNAASDEASYYYTGPQGGELLAMMMMIDRSGWQLKHMIIWAKNNHVLGRCDYNYKHEPILFGWKQKGTHKFYGPSNETSLWPIDKPLKNDLHPTMKPVELVERCIRNSSMVGQSVLDLFLGSGTTLIAAEKTGRICYGMELSEHYCDVIIKRWENFTGKKAELLP